MLSIKSRSLVACLTSTWLALAFVAMPIRGLAQTDKDAPVRWQGVEVVTNDFSAVSRIRDSVPVSPGAVMSLNDPKLRIACDAARGKLPNSTVSCSHTLAPSKDGTSQAWFIVEVDIPPSAPLRCLPAARLDPQLAQLARQWQDTLARATAAGKVGTERLNDRDFLDYDNADLSTWAARLHGATRGRAVELEAASVSCNPQDRASSFTLMNFSGDPQAFITMAATHVNDENPSVATAAARFLGTFAEFIEPRSGSHVASEACKSVMGGGFDGRQKALNLLGALQDRGAMPFTALAPECQRQVREIAKATLVLPAKELVSGSLQ